MFTQDIVFTLCDLIDSAVSWSNIVRDTTGFVRMRHGVIVDTSDIEVVRDLVDFELQEQHMGESTLILDTFWDGSDFFQGVR